MKILLGVLLAMAMLQQSAEHNRGDITFITIADEGKFAAAVRLNKNTDSATHAVITIFYWADFNGQRLLLTKTSVVPLVEGAFAMGDAVSIPREKVKSVKVALVRQVGEEVFELEP